MTVTLCVPACRQVADGVNETLTDWRCDFSEKDKKTAYIMIDSC